ncbi:MAG: ribosomal-protein-alanine N-acetyltransferase [Marivirga sp.]|jgi:ribosomal-protein-alanine N-acetyltransferase
MENTDYYHQESEQFYFRKMKMSDKQVWRAFFIDNDRLRFLGIQSADNTPDQLAEIFIQRQLDRYKETGLGQLAVHLKNTNEFVGVAGVLAKTIDNTLMHEVAYSLLPVYWGKGYATEMAQQMKHFGFKQLGLKSMVSIIHIENYDSAKVAIKNGMTIWKNSYHLNMDVLVYKITNSVN